MNIIEGHLPVRLTAVGHTFSICIVDDEEVPGDPTILVFRDDEEAPVAVIHLDNETSDCTDYDHITVEAPPL